MNGVVLGQPDVRVGFLYNLMPVEKKYVKCWTYCPRFCDEIIKLKEGKWITPDDVLDVMVHLYESSIQGQDTLVGMARGKARSSIIAINDALHPNSPYLGI